MAADGKDEALAAFREYDFDSSADFKAHLRNVELPPGDVRALLKVKAKFYKRAVDPNFDITWVADLSGRPSASGTAAAAGAASQPPPAPQQQQQQSAPQQQPWQQQQQPPPAGAARGRVRHVQAVALLHALTLLLALLYLQPLAARLSAYAYGKLMLVLLLAQGLRMHAAHGLPGSWRLAVVQPWLQRALTSSDGHYLLLAFMAAGNRPVTAVLPPFAIRAAYGLADAARALGGGTRLWARRGAALHAALQARQPAALALCAQSEVMLGFAMVVGLLLPSRAPLFAFMVWQFLRMRYWSPDGAAYHRQVWGQLDQKTAHIRQQLPLLQKAVAFGVSFFNPARPQR